MRIYSDRTVDQEFADLGTLGFTVMSSYYPVAIQSWYNKGPINSHDVVWIKGGPPK
jgi:hypothetical protein